MRKALALIITGLILILVTMPVAAADNQKFFVCKYEGTPGVDERLQTGDNPISVSASAIGEDPVVVGSFFSDAQGRSFVLAEDVGQPEPDVNTCPPPDTGGSPTPSPSLSPSPSPSESPPPSFSPSPSPLPTPSSTPSEPPGGIEFSVTTCPSDATASTDFLAGITSLVIPEGQSAIRFSVARAALLITTLNVRIDGVLLTLENTLGDGTVGDRVVSPGLHTWSISNAADTEVLAEGEILCPVCNPTTAPPPVAPVPDTAMPLAQAVTMVAGIMLSMLGVLLLVNALAVRRRKEE